MAIKTIEYKVLDSFSPTNETLSTKNFSLDVADKAKYVVHRAVKTAKANNVQLTRATKTRSEVSGGGRKPWKQNQKQFTRKLIKKKNNSLYKLPFITNKVR